MFTPVYLRDSPAYFHPRVLVGPGAFLTMPFVKKHNISHVINCAANEDCPGWWQMFFPTKYAVLNAIDSLHVNILDWYPAFERTLQAFLREGTGVVYVHCQAGMNRSGFLALAYTCKNLGVSLEDAFRSVRQQRSCILQNPVFMNQVKEFVNGCVQNPEAPGSAVHSDNHRNTGLVTSGNHSNAERVQDQAGDSSRGT